MSSPTLVSKQTAGVDQLIHQIRNHSLQWAEQLAGTADRRELEGIVSRLFHEVRLFKELIDQTDEAISTADNMSKKIHDFMLTNLHRGLALKDLAKFLGYLKNTVRNCFRCI